MAQHKLILLVDCNNFFVSCERVFTPFLQQKPCVVLSRGDGVVIARSSEAKALGIPMGAYVFEYEKLFKKYGVHTFASNFSLYADMSRRVMHTLESFGFPLEVYSVDEAFLQFEIESFELAYAFAERVKERVMRWTGIPVSCGVAATKTLSKVANHFAKKEAHFQGVALIEESTRLEFLEHLSVEDIWGIGKKSAARLRKKQIYTAKDLQGADDAVIKKELTVQGVRIALELRGVSCLEIHEVSERKKSISMSRLFDDLLDSEEACAEKVAKYMAEVAAELRQEKSLATMLAVWYVAKKDDGTLTTQSLSCHLEAPTWQTPELIKQAKKIFSRLFLQGIQYRKVGVWVGGLIPSEGYSGDLFSRREEKKEKLMQAIDEINAKFCSSTQGKKTLSFAAEGLASYRRSELCSNSYTTSWDELVTI